MNLSDSDFGLSLKDIPMEIEKIVAFGNISYIEATIHMCEKHNIEPESMRKILNKTLKEKIEAEASKSKMLKKEYRSNTVEIF